MKSFRQSENIMMSFRQSKNVMINSIVLGLRVWVRAGISGNTFLVKRVFEQV